MPRGKKREENIVNNEVIEKDVPNKPREQEVEVAGVKAKVTNEKVPGRPKGHEDSKQSEDEHYSFVYRDSNNKLNRKVFKVFWVTRRLYDEATGKTIEKKVKHTRLDRIEKNISQKDAMNK